MTVFKGASVYRNQISLLSGWSVHSGHFLKIKFLITSGVIGLRPAQVKKRVYNDIKRSFPEQSSLTISNSSSEHWGLQAWSWQTTRRSPLSASFCLMGFLLPCSLVKGLPSTCPPRFQLPHCTRTLNPVLRPLRPAQTSLATLNRYSHSAFTYLESGCKFNKSLCWAKISARSSFSNSFTPHEQPSLAHLPPIYVSTP